MKRLFGNMLVLALNLYSRYMNMYNSQKTLNHPFSPVDPAARLQAGLLSAVAGSH